MRAVTFFDGTRWREGIVAVAEEGRMLLHDEHPSADLPRIDGVIVGGFTDHHVHLQLVDHALLADSVLGRVLDLGGDPQVLRSLTGGAVEVGFAGAFLTPPGGYPSDRSWAPEGSWREVSDAAEAASAAAEMAEAGASCIKVADNSTAGPVFDDDLFRALVGEAAAHGLPVVVHAEGEGEAQRAARLGAATLAHSPFTERLSDAEIAEQAASVSWISTLAIHDGEALAIATDNVRRFHAAGGTVLYGTDMGNGPTPVGLNRREVDALRDAGVAATALLRALAPQDPLDPASRLLILPGPSPETADPLQARPLTSSADPEV